MSEQLLTPDVWWPMLSASALIAIPLAILATAAIASLFRARVRRSMLAAAAGAGAVSIECPVPAAEGVHRPMASVTLSNISQEDVVQTPPALFRITRAVFQLRLIYACAALAFGAIASLAYLSIFEIPASAYRFAFVMLIFATPLPLALLLLESGSPRALLLAAIAWCTLVVLSVLPYLAPWVSLEIWFFWTGVPTAIAVLFSGRRLRAGGPPLFAATWMLVAAFLGGLSYAGSRIAEDLGLQFVRPDLAALPLTEASSQFLSELVARAKNEGPTAAREMLSDRSLLMVQHPERATYGYVVLLHVVWFAPVALAAVLAWGLFAWHSRRYQARRSSDVMLKIDTLFLTYTMSFVLLTLTAGRGWANAGLFVLPFLAYKAASAAGLRILKPVDSPALTLLFLRVFGYERRTQSLLDSLAARWRHVGPIRLIAGTDSAYASLEPHEFYEFLGGRLSRQFIAGAADLEQRLPRAGVAPDPDGLYRVEDFYCHRDTWQMVVARLVRESDAILMDLRGFSEANQGCIFELRELVRTAPLSRTLLLVDRTTDLRLLEATTRAAWTALPANSPNFAEPAPTIALLHANGSTGRIPSSLLHALLTRATADSGSIPWCSSTGTDYQNN